MKYLVALLLTLLHLAAKSATVVVYVNGGSAPTERITPQANAFAQSALRNGVPESYDLRYFPISQTSTESGAAILCQRELSRSSFPTQGTRPTANEYATYFQNLGSRYVNFAQSVALNPISCPVVSAGIIRMASFTRNLANELAELSSGDDTIILVGYSQGNNYIEAAVGLMLARGEIDNPSRFKMVGIASPAFSSGRHINASLDQVVYGALNSPASLTPNHTLCVDSCSQPASIDDIVAAGGSSNVHFLVPNYLNESINSLERLTSIPAVIASEIVASADQDSMSMFTDTFDRNNNSNVSNNWIEESYFNNGNNVNFVDAAEILNNQLRIAHDFGGANIDAGLYRSNSRSCGVVITGSVEWATNLAATMVVGTNAQQSIDQRGLQLQLAPSLSGTHQIAVAHEGAFVRAPVPYTFTTGVPYRFEWTVRPNCSSDVRVWRSTQSRPSTPTTTSPAVTLVVRSNPLLALFASGGSGCCEYPGYDLRIDDFRITRND